MAIVFVIDIDECGVQKCGENSKTCTNVEGSYLCECEEGFWFDQSSYGSTCQSNVISLSEFYLIVVFDWKQLEN